MVKIEIYIYEIFLYWVPPPLRRNRSIHTYTLYINVLYIPVQYICDSQYVPSYNIVFHLVQLKSSLKSVVVMLFTLVSTHKHYTSSNTTLRSI